MFHIFLESFYCFSDLTKQSNLGLFQLPKLPAAKPLCRFDYCFTCSKNSQAKEVGGGYFDVCSRPIKFY
jgi:hypothetical protein